MTIEYPRLTINGRQVRKHIAAAEKALGKPLPEGAVVHHVDENPLNNDPSNLVICPDQAYHLLLHRRMKAMAATGDPNQRPCRRCKEHDHESNLERIVGVTARGFPSLAFEHAACRREYSKQFRQKGVA